MRNVGDEDSHTKSSCELQTSENSLHDQFYLTFVEKETTALLYFHDSRGREEAEKFKTSRKVVTWGADHGYDILFEFSANYGRRQ